MTLFKYFKNKNNLINTVILQSFEETTQEIEAILQSQLDFEATYEAITTMEIAKFGRYKPIFSENLLTQYHENPDFFNRDAVSAQSRIYEQLFQKGQAEGKIAATYSKADFMFVLTLFINGLKGLSTDQLIQKSALISHFFITGWK